MTHFLYPCNTKENVSSFNLKHKNSSHCTYSKVRRFIRTIRLASIFHCFKSDKNFSLLGSFSLKLDKKSFFISKVKSNESNSIHNECEWKPKKNIKFLDSVMVFETYSIDNYERAGPTQKDFSDYEIETIIKEIKEFKTREMLVHPSSKKNTTFSV